FLPFIYLRLAKLYQVEGNWFDSKKYFSLLREKFPESIEVNIINPYEEEIDFFTVQVGAFREKENAQALRDQLSKDFPVYILEDIKKGYPLYKVRVGKFKDKTQAQRVYYQLIRKGYPAKIYP
ncbi:MAG: SPOR domain-containing protein, partial [Candidatus Aenigmatarchaeota archaeon]